MEQAPSDPLALRLARAVWSASCVPALVTGSHPACCTPSTCRHGRAGLRLSACSLSALSWPLPPPSPPRGPQGALARLGTPHSPHLQQARARHQLAASLARPGSGQGLSPQPAGGSWEPGPGCLGGLLQLLRGGPLCLAEDKDAGCPEGFELDPQGAFCVGEPFPEPRGWERAWKPRPQIPSHLEGPAPAPAPTPATLHQAASLSCPAGFALAWDHRNWRGEWSLRESPGPRTLAGAPHLGTACS